jgi:TRAP transporter TAXI family solute receptor
VSVRRINALVAVLLVTVLVSACGSTATPSPTTAPSKPAETKPAEAPKPAASPAAAAASPAAGAAASPVAAAASPVAAGASPVAAASPAAAASPGPAASPAVKPVAAAQPPMDPGPCTSANANKPRPSGTARLVISTGGTGGVFFPYGGGLARIISARLPNTQMTAEVTGGSVDNFKLINSNEADLGMSTTDSAYDAFNGTGAYQDTGKIPGCTIATLYQSYVHIVALDGTGINTVADMRGKRVSVGSAGSSTEGAADRILEAAGLDPRRDITRDNLSVAESVSAMKDRKIDAFFWIGGLPTAAVTDLVSTPNLRVKFVPGDQYIPPMRAKYGPLYNPFDLPGNVYAGVTTPVPGIGIGNILFVNANMSEDLVFDILRVIFDNLAEVRQIHPEAESLSLEAAATGSSIPFHPGAIRFYRERGVWRG